MRVTAVRGFCQGSRGGALMVVAETSRWPLRPPGGRSLGFGVGMAEAVLGLEYFGI